MKESNFTLTKSELVAVHAWCNHTGRMLFDVLEHCIENSEYFCAIYDWHSANEIEKDRRSEVARIERDIFA